MNFVCKVSLIMLMSCNQVGATTVKRPVLKKRTMLIYSTARRPEITACPRLTGMCLNRFIPL